MCGAPGEWVEEYMSGQEDAGSPPLITMSDREIKQAILRERRWCMNHEKDMRFTLAQACRRRIDELLDILCERGYGR